MNFVFGFIFVLIAALIFGETKIPSIPGILGAAYVGLFEMGITFAVWSKALELSANTAKVSNLVYLVPFISLIPIHFLVGEEIMASTIIGLVFIISGIFIQQYDTLRKL